MKISLCLYEMFILNAIIDAQEVLGYKAAMIRLYQEMLKIKEFSEIVELYKIINHNSIEIFKKHREDTDSKNIKEELDKANNTYIEQVNNLLKDRDRIYNFDLDEMMIKAIKNIAESLKTPQELKINPSIVPVLMSIYQKLLNLEK